MALPGITITINPNGLRQLAASGASVCAKLGVSSAGTANTLYSFADPATATSTLGIGPLVEAVVDTMATAGGTVLAIKLPNTTAGSVGATTAGPGNSGTGTVVGSITSVVPPLNSPFDKYAVLVTITTAGALGVAVFTYSLDGGNNTSGQILVPAGGVFNIPNTNVTLTFANTFVLGNTYAIAAVPAAFTTGDVTTALGVLLADPTEWGFVHIVGMGTNAAAAASMAAVVDTQMVLAEAAFRYVFGVVECPTTEADATVATAFASFASERTMVCAGDIGHISAINGVVIRRNCGTVVTSRLSLIPVSEHPGAVARGPLRNVKSLYRNESSTPYLDAQRFTTLRTFVKKQGYFVTRGKMMAANGSDYDNVMNRRVMDVACGYAYASMLEILNSKIQVDKKTGFIYEPAAVAAESFIRNQIFVGLDGNAIEVSVRVSRTEPILSTKRYPIDIGIVPYGYAETIKATIGFVNPALA